MIATILQAVPAPAPTSAPAAGASVEGIIGYLTVFVLAAFVGMEVISKVPSILHTPLMSGSNAIHGIVLVGALAIMGEAHGTAQVTLGFLAVLLATLNIEMFKSKPGDTAKASKAPAQDPGAGHPPGSAS
jgi:NAD(P) transhydrogenase subunit alpha